MWLFANGQHHQGRWKNKDVLVATNVIASRPPKRQPTGTLTACAKTTTIPAGNRVKCSFLSLRSDQVHSQVGWLDELGIRFN